MLLALTSPPGHVAILSLNGDKSGLVSERQHSLGDEVVQTCKRCLRSGGRSEVGENSLKGNSAGNFPRGTRQREFTQEFTVDRGKFSVSSDTSITHSHISPH